MPRPRKAANANESVGAVALPGPIFSAAAIDRALPKSAQVYEIVRRAIVGLEMPPGAPVSEKLICEQLGISRTPLREAILQLHAEKLVDVRPNSGTFVSRSTCSTLWTARSFARRWR